MADAVSKHGWVDDLDDALISVELGGGRAIEFVIDTGFDGELLLPLDFAEILKLPLLGERNLLVVGGGTITAFTSIVKIDWLGVQRTTELILSEGTDQLIGTRLLRGTLLGIDYINHLVEIEKP